MADIYASEEFPVVQDEVLEAKLTYSCNKGTGYREGTFNRKIHFKITKLPKPITKQDFIDLFFTELLVDGFAKLQGKSVKWEKLIVKRMDRKEALIFKKLRSIYGSMDRPVDVDKGFLFDVHSSSNVYPQRLFIRGVPDDLRQFDRKGFDNYYDMVRAVEMLFLRNLGSDNLMFRLVTAVQSKDSEFHEIREITSVEGMGLQSFKPPKKKEKKKVPSF